jgi:hypothetical protein
VRCVAKRNLDELVIGEWKREWQEIVTKTAKMIQNVRTLYSRKPLAARSKDLFRHGLDETYVSVRACMCVCVWVCKCVWVCVCLCMCMHACSVRTVLSNFFVRIDGPKYHSHSSEEREI